MRGHSMHFYSAHIAPIRRIETARLGPTPDMFRSCLGNIFTSDVGLAMKQQLLRVWMTQIAWPCATLTLQKVGAVLRDLHYGKAADANGMVAEYVHTAAFLCTHVCWIFTVR